MGKYEKVGGIGFILIFNENSFLDFYSTIIFKFICVFKNCFDFVS